MADHPQKGVPSNPSGGHKTMSAPVVARGLTNNSQMNGAGKGMNMKPVNVGSMHMGGMKDESDNLSGEIDPRGRR